MGNKEYTDERNWVKNISTLKLEPGDALVIKTATRLSFNQIQSIQDNLKNLLKKMGKEGTPILILDQGFDIEKLQIQEIVKKENEKDSKV